MSAAFDWYECSLDGLKLDLSIRRYRDLYANYTGKEELTARVFARELLQLIADDQAFGVEMEKNSWRLDDFELRKERGFNHYRCCLVCYTPLRVSLFRLLWSPGTSIHLISSGKRSPLVSSAVRKLCPLHYVTRADSALDFDQAGDWLRLVNLSEQIREGVLLGRRLSSTQVLQDEETGGKTYYLGSLKSTCFMRIYDKTIEQRHNAPKHLRKDIPENWTRAEIVSRPDDKERRLFLAKCDPADVWSSSPATAEFYKAVCAGEIGHMPKAAPRVEDFNKAWWTMLQQYKRTIAWGLKISGGSWPELAARMQHDMTAADLL